MLKVCLPQPHFAYRSFCCFCGAAMTAMRYRARDDGQIGDSATWLVSAAFGCSTLAVLASAGVLSRELPNSGRNKYQRESLNFGLLKATCSIISVPQNLRFSICR